MRFAKLERICRTKSTPACSKAFANGKSRDPGAPRLPFGGVVLFVFLLLATFDIGRATAERDRLIVDLHAANERTTASRDLLHTTLTSIGDAVIATDAAGSVTFMNGVAEQLTGWKQAEAEGQARDRVLDRE